MHTLTINGSWEIDFLRDDSDITPDGVTTSDLAGCCDIHCRRQDDNYIAKIEITEKRHNLELIVTALVFEKIPETTEEFIELTSIYTVERVFTERYCLRVYNLGCKKKAFQYAEELTQKIDRRYFSVNDENQDNKNQLELPLIFY
mgnify:CR=1 FL=1